MRLKNPRQHDDKHLDFIRSLPCCVCGNNIETQAAHIRFSDARYAKSNAGVGQKPHDFWCVPLCSADHRSQHDGDERSWWQSKGIDPLRVAMALYLNTGDHERGTQIVALARHKFEAAA